MGGCYNASLSTMPLKPGLPQEPQQESAASASAPAAPAASDAASGAASGEAAAAFRRRGRRMRKAAFGASKSVSCDDTLFDVIKSMLQKPNDVACTLSTLHKVFHGVIITVLLLRVAVEVVAMVLKLLQVPSTVVDPISSRTIPLIMLVYLGAVVVRTFNSKKTTTGQQLSSLIEIVVAVMFYALPLGQSAFKGVPVLDQIVKFLNELSSGTKRGLGNIPGVDRLLSRLNQASGAVVSGQ
jgi:hypothetical protein